MKVELVNETLDDVLRPKSENEIEKVLGNLSPNKLLIKVSELGLVEWVKKALIDGADVHTEDDYALMWAAYNGHVEVVKVLLEAGANVHINNDEALRWSVEKGHTKIVNLLKKYGK